jgi:hypothetical protein
VQAALGLQHEKMMSHISSAARQRAERGELEASVKDVAPLMQSIRRIPPSALPSDVDAAEPKVSQLEAAASSTSHGGYPADENPTPAHVPPESTNWKIARTPQGHTYYFDVSTKESQWERPAALGGPVTYKVGDEVEVWSNSQHCWGIGTVTKAQADFVTVDFLLPNGSKAVKELPASHRDLRHAVHSAPTENLSPEEDELYRRLFNALSGGTATKKHAKVVADFLQKSGAQVPTLRQIWAVCNPGLKQEMDFDDFAHCCRCIAHCQSLGLDSPMVAAGERPLRVALRTTCLFTKPKQLPTFDK